MPIYEYSCTDCQHEFEIKQKITDGPLEVCPECGGSLRKLISKSSFALKGTGWYRTDYAGDRKKAEPAKKEQGGTSCGDSGSSPACTGCPNAA